MSAHQIPAEHKVLESLYSIPDDLWVLDRQDPYGGTKYNAQYWAFFGFGVDKQTLEDLGFVEDLQTFSRCETEVTESLWHFDGGGQIADVSVQLLNSVDDVSLKRALLDSPRPASGTNAIVKLRERSNILRNLMLTRLLLKPKKDEDDELTRLRKEVADLKRRQSRR